MREMPTIQTVSKKDLITFKLNKGYLDELIKYVFTFSDYVKQRYIKNLYKFLQLLDLSPYENEDYIMAGIAVVKKVAELRIRGIKNEESLYNAVINIDQYSEEIEESYIDVLYERNTQSREELELISESISERIKYHSLVKSLDPLIEVAEEIQQGNRSVDFQEITERIQTLISNTLTECRRANVANDLFIPFDIDGKNIVDQISPMIEKLQEDRNKLYLGVQALNHALGDGLERQRVYTFLGLSGDFKSGLLLNICRWIRIYNKDYRLKDPTRKPCVIMFTQENSLVETFERYYALTVDGVAIEKQTFDEVLNKYLTHAIAGDEKSEINIRIVYRPNQSVNTDFCNDLIDEAEEEGYEVIAFVHDYIERIRSLRSLPDLRLELGEVINDFKSMAMVRDIPFITAAQLNRSAAQTIEKALEQGQSDLGKLLETSNIGESYGIVKNGDWLGIIKREDDRETNDPYLSIKTIKRRGKLTPEAKKYSFFSQPFDAIKPMRIKDDLGNKEPLARSSLSNAQFNNTPVKRNNNSQSAPTRTTNKFNGSGFGNARSINVRPASADIVNNEVNI